MDGRGGMMLPFKHNQTFQGVASEQQAEIKRLRNEINRLSMFRSTVRNYQVQTKYTCKKNHGFSEFLAVLKISVHLCRIKIVMSRR